MYAKLFSRIAQSSLMEEKVTTRYVFMMMLAIADRHGDVIGTDIAIARTMNVTPDEFSNSVMPLLSPDPASNSQAEEGRRLVPSENGRGYRIVNYHAYRDMKSDEEKREYMRNYMRERRASKDSVKSGKDSVKSVKIRKSLLSDVTHTEAEAEAEAKSIPIKEKKPQVAVVLPFESESFTSAWGDWLSHKREIKQKMPDSTISAQLKQLAKWGEAGAIQSIENSIAGKWQGLFQPKPTSGQASNQKQTKTNSVHEMGLS